MRMVVTLLFNYGRMDTMHLKGNQFIKVAFLLMLTAFTITGCGGSLFTYNGYKVTQQNLTVQLEDGNQQGEWKTNELAVKYQYQKAPETLKISGTVEMVSGFKYFSQLAVYLLFLDNRGIVIENSLIYAGENDHPIITIPMDFDKTIPIPEGTRKISFAYDLSPVRGK
jgi:hypothetical protein